MGHKEKDLLTPSLVCAKLHLTFLLYSYKGRALVLPQLGMGMESRLVGGGIAAGLVCSWHHSLWQALAFRCHFSCCICSNSFPKRG